MPHLPAAVLITLTSGRRGVSFGPKFGIQTLLNALITKIWLSRVVFCLSYQLQFWRSSPAEYWTRQPDIQSVSILTKPCTQNLLDVLITSGRGGARLSL